MNRQIHCEGENERNAVALLEVMPDVLTYQEQPALGIVRNANRTDHLVFPDFEVRYRSGSSTIIDVVRVRRIQEQKLTEKMRQIGRRCKELGFRYRIWTDHDIERQPRLSAANTICWRGRGKLSPSVKDLSTHYAHPGLTVGEVRQALGVSMNELCALVLQGYMAVDVNLGLSDSTPVLGPGWRSGENG